MAVTQATQAPQPGTSTNPADYSTNFLQFGNKRYPVLPSFAGFPGPQWTISTWVEPQGQSGSVFQVGTDHVLFDLKLDSGNLTFTFYPTSEQLATTGALLTQGQWHHIALTFQENNDTQATMKLYVDSVKRMERVISLDVKSLPTTTRLVIGAAPPENQEDIWSSGLHLFPGQMRDFRVWAYAMNDEQVAADQRMTVQGREPQLLLAYPLDAAHMDLGKVQVVNLTTPALNAQWVSDPTSQVTWGWRRSTKFPVIPLTVGAWVRCGSDSESTSLFSYSESEDGGNTGTRLWVTGYDKITIWFGGSSYTSPSLGFSDGKWHHLAIALAPAGGNKFSVAIFKDCKLVGQGQMYHDEGQNLTSGYQLVLGARFPQQDDAAYKGLMRGFTVWSKALGEADLRARVLADPAKQTEVALAYTLDPAADGSQQITARDLSPNRQDLSIDAAKSLGGGWIDFSGTDLSKASGWQLQGAYLRNAVLDRVNLAGQSLVGADLTGAALTNLTTAQLQGVDLQGAMLFGTDFSGSDTTGAIFDGAPRFARNERVRTRFAGGKVNFAVLGKDWRYLDLTRAEVVDLPSQLGGLNASYAVLAGMQLGSKVFTPGASFVKADLREATCDGSDFTGLDLSGANLSNGSFVRCNFQGAKLIQAFLRNARIQYCNLKTADLSGAFGDSTSRDGAAKFFRSYMVNANLSDAQLNFADLEEVHFYGTTATATRTNLTGAGFNGAILSSLDLSRAILQGTDFTGAQAINVSFRGATLKDCRFQKAYLQGADFSNAQVTACNFTGALFGTNGTEAGYVRVTEQDGTTYTVQWSALDVSKVHLDQTCTCPDGLGGACSTLSRFEPDKGLMPFPPVPDNVPDGGHSVDPPPDWGIPGV